MPSLDIHHENRVLTLVHDTAVVLSLPLFKDIELLMKLVSEHVAQTPLVELQIRDQDPVGDNIYRYTFDTTNDRHWRQDVRLTPTGIYITFLNIEGEWSVSEFLAQIPVRNQLTVLLSKYGFSRITVSWP